MVDFSSKPQVVINLDPVLEAFCRTVFKTPRNQKEIVIHRARREGQAIYSKIFPVKYPPKKPFCDNPVIFILPMTKNNQHTLMYNFYKIDKMGEEQIHDDLTVLMDKWLWRFFRRGYARKYKQDEIISAILRILNLRKNVANYDAIKKFDYRQRRRNEDEMIDELLRLSDLVC